MRQPVGRTTQPAHGQRHPVLRAVTIVTLATLATAAISHWWGRVATPPSDGEGPPRTVSPTSSVVAIRTDLEDLVAKTADLLRDDPAAPPVASGPLSARTIALEQDGGEDRHAGEDESWNDLPRETSDFFALVTRNPQRFRLRSVWRHPQLNPRDLPIEHAARTALTATLTPLLQQIRKVRDLYARSLSMEFDEAVRVGMAVPAGDGKATPQPPVATASAAPIAQRDPEALREHLKQVPERSRKELEDAFSKQVAGRRRSDLTSMEAGYVYKYVNGNLLRVPVQALEVSQTANVYQRMLIARLGKSISGWFTGRGLCDPPTRAKIDQRFDQFSRVPSALPR